MHVLITRDFITPSSRPHILVYFLFPHQLLFLYHGMILTRFRLRTILNDVCKSMASFVQAIQLCHNWKYQEVIEALAVV
jgi:hypothetical protein